MNNVTDAELRELLDQHQIRALIHRYCRAVDRRQYDDLRSCYHPEATDHHGDFYGTVDEFVAYVEQGVQSYEATMHFVANLSVEVAGDAARSETYVLALARARLADVLPARDNTVALRYVDDLERRDGEWRILRRVCVYEWTRTDDVPSGWTLPDNFLRGRADADDPVFLPVLEAPRVTPTPVPRRI